MKISTIFKSLCSNEGGIDCGENESPQIVNRSNSTSSNSSRPNSEGMPTLREEVVTENGGVSPCPDQGAPCADGVSTCSATSTTNGGAVVCSHEKKSEKGKNTTSSRYSYG